MKNTGVHDKGLKFNPVDQGSQPIGSRSLESYRIVQSPGIHKCSCIILVHARRTTIIWGRGEAFLC